MPVLGIKIDQIREDKAVKILFDCFCSLDHTVRVARDVHCLRHTLAVKDVTDLADGVNRLASLLYHVERRIGRRCDRIVLAV